MDWRTKKGLLIDLDGTLFRGNTVLRGAREFIAQARKEGIPFLYWTNNSTRTPEAVAQHLQQLGFLAKPSDVYTSSLALFDVMMTRHPKEQGDNVYIVGEEGLRAALSQGFRTLAQEDVVDSAFAVAVGLDRQITYDRLRYAVRFILKGAAFYATNPDRLIWEDDGLAPGAGSLVKLLEFATGKQPVLIGKPEASFVHAACSKLGIKAQDTLVIGDNPLTDIAAGRKAGASTILIESALQEDGHAEYKADWQISSLADLLA